MITGHAATEPISMLGAVSPDMRDGEHHFEMPAELRKLREGDQGYPTKNSLPSMHEQAREDISKRKAIGVERYGVALQPANGRDAIRDWYEEALDGVVYGAQVVWEQEHPEETYVGKLIESYMLAKPLDFTGVFVPEAVTRLIAAWEARGE